MLEYNEIKDKKVIIYNSEPCEVVEYHVARTQQRKPQNQVKLKSLISGKTFGATFHTSDKAEEADISKKEIKFLYTNKGEYWFCDPENPKDRFQIDGAVIGDSTKFLKENELVNALIWNYNDDEKMINIEIPVKMEFTIKECPPNIKGNTAQGGNKPATLENGAIVNVPLFLNPGDKIIVNTQTGEYVERVS